MEPISPYLITELPGFTPQISRLVVMLDYARHTTLHAVRDLSIAQLDHRHDDASNSIGMLLAHIASNDFYFRLLTMERRTPTPDELQQWGPALDLGEAAREAIHGNPLSYYIDMLDHERAAVLRTLADTPDSWLDIVRNDLLSKPTNHYFAWFHVIEDEINHRGQIRWLRKRL